MDNYNEDNNNEKAEDSSVDIKEIADTKGKTSYLQLSKLQNSINECSLKNIINNVNTRSEDDLDNMIKSSYHYRHYQANVAQVRLLRAILETQK